MSSHITAKNADALPLVLFIFSLLLIRNPEVYFR